MKRLLLLLVASILIAAPAIAAGPESPSAFLLVATPELRGPYAAKVIAVMQYPGGHFGVMLNQPSRITLAEVFPADAASQKVREPVFVGGPEGGLVVQAISAGDRPGPQAVELLPGIWLCLGGKEVDAVISKSGSAARYFAGAVLWDPGELEFEVEHGYWTRRPATPDTLLSKDTSKLWERLRYKGPEA